MNFHGLKIKGWRCRVSFNRVCINMCQVQSNTRLLAKACIRCACLDSTNNNITRCIYSNSKSSIPQSYFIPTAHWRFKPFSAIVFPFCRFLHFFCLAFANINLSLALLLLLYMLIDCKVWNWFSFVVFSVFLPMNSKPLIVSAWNLVCILWRTT